MVFDLPRSVDINGEAFKIRYHYGVILEIFELLSDVDLNGKEKTFALLQMFYVDWEQITDYDEALKQCFWFINGGKSDEQTQRNRPKLVNWEHDFFYIISPINHVLGYEVREREYNTETNTGGVHWWTFLSAYTEIGDCFFAQIVNIRNKKARGKPLEKHEQEFYRQNRALIDVAQKYSEAEQALLKEWI